MLLLTRRVGEVVMIGDEITVTVLGVKGNQVRIGVNAPKSVAVHREEIFDRIKDGVPPPSRMVNGARVSPPEPGVVVVEQSMTLPAGNAKAAAEAIAAAGVKDASRRM